MLVGLGLGLGLYICCVICCAFMYHIYRCVIFVHVPYIDCIMYVCIWCILYISQDDDADEAGDGKVVDYTGMSAAGVLENIRNKKKAFSSQLWRIKPYETKEYIIQNERRSQQSWWNELKSGGKYATIWHQDGKLTCTCYLFYIHMIIVYYKYSSICQSAHTRMYT